MTNPLVRTGTFRLGDYRIDPDRLVISRGDEAVTVEPKTMGVLVALAGRAGEVVSADELIEVVWEGRALGDNPVYGAVAKLRRALGDDAREARFIETVPRRGYRLAVAPQPAGAESPPDEAPADTVQRRPRAGPAVAVAVAVAVAAAVLWWALGRDRDAPAATMPAVATGSPALAIAVVPFTNVSGDPAFDAFGAGFSEDVLDTLARIDDLRVIARTSAFAAGAGGPEIPQLAQALGVTYVVTGTVHPQGDRLRISARLLAADGQQIWSDSYERPLEESLDVRLEVAESIARMLSRTLSQRDATRRATVPVPALQSFLDGRELTWLGLVRHAEEASRAYERALELAPDYADAHAGLARVHVHEGRREEALRHARRALELDPDAAEAHLVLGLLAYREQRPDWAGAESHLRRAVELNPSLSEARHYLATTLRAQGRVREALEQREIGLQRDPLHYNLARAVAKARAERGELDSALSLIRRALSWPQVDEPALADLGTILWRWSRYAEMVLESRALGDALPGSLEVDVRARVVAGLARLGLFDDAMAAYEQIRGELSWPGWGAGGIAADLRVSYLADVGRWDLVDDELTALGALVAREGRGRPQWLDRNVGVARIRAGRFAEGIAKLEDVVSAPAYRGEVGYPDERELLAAAYLRTGQVAEATAVLRRLEEHFRLLEDQGFARDPASRAHLARIHALAGDRAAAVATLTEALDLGWVGYYELRDDPRWEGLRSHPSFAALARRALGVVETQRRLLE